MPRVGQACSNWHNRDCRARNTLGFFKDGHAGISSEYMDLVHTMRNRKTERGPGYCRHSTTCAFYILSTACLFLVVGCGGKKRVKLPPPIPATLGWTEKGIASWYGRPYHGRTTSNGERYNMNKISAAHKSLPFGTWVRVTNLGNNKAIEVRINDRGPFVKGRIIDLSFAAARKIDMIEPGTARVKLKVLARPGTRHRPGKTYHPAVYGGSCSAVAYFGVQIGAFKVVENAESLLEKMADTKLSFNRRPQIIESQLVQGIHYRVVVGRFTRVNVARRLKNELQGMGIDGFVSEFEVPLPPDCQ